jgi:hypothetical protein
MAADKQIRIQPIFRANRRCDSPCTPGGALACVRSNSIDQRTNIMTKRLTALRTNWANKQQGGMGYVLLWLLGVPIPVLILISLLRGCN